MKKILFGFVVLVFSVTWCKAQTTIAQWTMNGTSMSTVPGGVSTPTVTTGTGTLSLIGGATGAFNTGSPTDPVTPTGNNFSWETTGYPAALTAEKTAGIVIAINTTGFTTLTLSFDQRISSTAANTWIVYYTADVTATTPDWEQAKIFTFTPAATGTGDMWYSGRTVDFSPYPALEDNATAAFKIVSAFDPTALNYLASTSTKTYATTGKSRFDLITLTGVTKIITNNTVPVVSNVAFTGKLNAGSVLTASYVYNDAEGDIEEGSLIQWYRADDAGGTNQEEIDEANFTTYTLTENDKGKVIAFKITPAAKTGKSPGQAVLSAWQGPVNESLEILLYPSPWNLSHGNYAMNNWPASSSPGTYPANMNFQQFDTEPSSADRAPDELWQCTYNNTSHSRVLGLDNLGFAFINTSDVQSTPQLCGNLENVGGYVGTAVLALNTSIVHSITLSWLVSMTIQGSGTPAREYRLRPQYKLAGASSWTDLDNDLEFSSAGATVNQDVLMNILLPPQLEDQPLVYIRWIYYQVDAGQSGSRPELRIDDITVTYPGAPNNAPVASNVSVVGLSLVSQIQTATYTYSDTENDPQSGASFQWYTATDATGTSSTAIIAGNDKTYTTTQADIGKYIAVSVTPFATSGQATGQTVTSSYVGPIQDMGDPSILTINEVYSRGNTLSGDADLREDWIEFFNPGTKNVTVAGLTICDSGDCETLPGDASSVLTVPAGGFLAISQNAASSFTFGLSSLGEYVVLKRPDTGAQIDSLNFPALDSVTTFGRYSDGATRLTILIPPTKGKTNSTSEPQDAVTGLAGEKQLISSVYPVPTRTDFTVVSSAENTIQTIAVVSVTGQEILKVPATGTVTHVNFSEAKSGFYLLTLVHQNGIKEVRKIIKE